MIIKLIVGFFVIKVKVVAGAVVAVMAMEVVVVVGLMILRITSGIDGDSEELNFFNVPEISLRVLRQGLIFFFKLSKQICFILHLLVMQFCF